MVEQHLKQRAAAQVTVGRQGLHQLLEWQVLMFLGRQGLLLDLLQQLRKPGMGIDFGFEHLGVDEETDQPLSLTAVAVGNRHADTNIALGAVAMQQHLERGQQQHEQRHALLTRQGLERFGQPIGQGDIQARTAMTLQGRPWMVQGQLQHRLLTPQGRLPVAQLPLTLAGIHPLALPVRIVGVLHRQGRQLRWPALEGGGVQRKQILDHHLHRPAIRDDMVLHQHQHVFIGCQAQQADTQ